MTSLHAHEHGKSPDAVTAPTRPTVKKIFHEMCIPLRSLQQGVGVDKLRETKANETYLCDYFDKVEDVIQ